MENNKLLSSHKLKWDTRTSFYFLAPLGAPYGKECWWVHKFTPTSTSLLCWATWESRCSLGKKLHTSPPRRTNLLPLTQREICLTDCYFKEIIYESKQTWDGLQWILKTRKYSLYSDLIYKNNLFITCLGQQLPQLLRESLKATLKKRLWKSRWPRRAWLFLLFSILYGKKL